jgi:ketosteroid isomerase-like protein
MNETDPDIALILAAYAAYARGEIDQAVTALHPKVEWIEPVELPGGGRYVGPAAVAEYLRNSRANWSELVSEPKALRRDGRIIVTHHVHGRLADGAPGNATVADVFTVRDGQIVHMQAYTDPDQALADGS